jgi:ribose/xylose/arabinose/galactoside ABC-type transport system permease subunit
MTAKEPTKIPPSENGRAATPLPRLVGQALNLAVRYRTLTVFLGMLILGGVLSPQLLAIGNVTNVLRQASFNGLLSTGMTFVILTKGIDLSGGSILGVAAMVAGLLKDQNILIIFGAALSTGALLGVVNGVVIAKLRLEPFVVTLAMLTVARGIGLVVSRGYLITGVQETFREVGVGYVLGVPNPVIIMAVVFALAWFVLRYTQFGRRVYATGANGGLRARVVRAAVYAVRPPRLGDRGKRGGGPPGGRQRRSAQDRGVRNQRSARRPGGTGAGRPTSGGGSFVRLGL